MPIRVRGTSSSIDGSVCINVCGDAQDAQYIKSLFNDKGIGIAEAVGVPPSTTVLTLTGGKGVRINEESIRSSLQADANVEFLDDK